MCSIEWWHCRWPWVIHKSPQLPQFVHFAPPLIASQRVNLETSYLVHWFTIASPTLPIRNLPWKGRGRPTRSISRSNRNHASILYRFRDIASYLSKVADFDPPRLHLAPQQGVIPVEFRGDLWHPKTRVPGLSCSVVWVILRLAVLVELRLVTDTDRQRYRHRHRPMASTADA